MRVRILHTTRLEYTAEVVESVMDTRLGPRTDEHQRWERFDLRVDPPASVRRYGDAFGNVAHLISLARPHRHVEIVTRSEVETLLADPFATPRDAPRPIDPSDRHDYLGPSALIPLTLRLAGLAEDARPKDGDAFAAATRLMQLVHAEFAYTPDSTTVETAVPDVLESRAGVCQDLAHVLVGLCRSVGIPARYVSGYIVTGAGKDEPRRGAGHSHAWAEAWSATHGWRGFDPTNGLLASEHHVKMALGRDYRDVPPTKGTFRGDAAETLSVRVSATRT
ncbi:MAG TPA: transglutaminase family protein [Candidatus Limnocylindria bacterium]|nr:transglutaminase family protein [Candidatus Limnocylindria bacterium]